MTLRLQPGRFLVLLLCGLLALFLCVETAHGHMETGEHCQLCLLTHAVAILPALLTLPLVLCRLGCLVRVEPRRGSPCRVRAFRIRPPPFAA